MRQLVPFRDGGWGDVGSDSLAEYLFLHWRHASSQGYQPLLHSLRFFRSLFWIATATRKMTRGQDVLLEALEELRMDAAMSQFKQMMSLPQLTDSADKYGTIMMELPRKLDQALTLMAEGNALLKLSGARIAADSRQKNSSVVVIALLLLLGAVGVLSRHLSSAVAGVWIDRISAIVFIAFGVLLLRAAIGRQ